MASLFNVKTPRNEEERLALVEGWQLNALVEDSFYHDIAITAANLCDAPTGLVSIISRDEQVNLGRAGFDLECFSRDLSFCSVAVDQKKLLIVEDALEDPRFADNPLVIGDPQIRFYAGIPLLIDNRITVGALCVIDTRPRHLGMRERAGLMGLVHQVEQRLNAAVAQRHNDVPSLFPNEKHSPQAHQDMLLHKSMLGVHLLKNLRQHLAFLEADTSVLSPERTRPISGLVRNDMRAALATVEQLASTAQTILQDPRGLLSGDDTVSLKQCLESACRILKYQIQGRPGQMKISQTDADALVVGDPTLLTDLVIRLLEMTIRDSPPETAIAVTLEAQTPHVTLAVVSEGEVPPPASRRRIFDLPSRLDSDTEVDETSDFSWTRTLTLCGQITRAHRGEIALEEVGPRKRRCVVTLPLAAESA